MFQSPALSATPGPLAGPHAVRAAAAPLRRPLFFETATRLADAGLAAGILLFALATLRLQSRRRRKLPDVTLNYWRLGMASLIACVLVWIAAQLWPGWPPATPIRCCWACCSWPASRSAW